MKQIEQELNINLFNRFALAYRDREGIQTVNRNDFEKLIETRIITPETIVFNNLVTIRKELATNWEVAFRNSWHAQIFGLHSNV